jgi:hypothetical protein
MYSLTQTKSNSAAEWQRVAPREKVGKSPTREAGVSGLVTSKKSRLGILQVRSRYLAAQRDRSHIGEWTTQVRSVILAALGGLGCQKLKFFCSIEVQ